MTTPSTKFAGHYAKLNNHEVLRLAAQKDSLLEAARQALESELAKRGLGTASVAAYERGESEVLEQQENHRRLDSRNTWKRRFEVSGYLAILITGDLVTISLIHTVLNLPAEAVRVLTKISLQCALAVAAMGMAFAGRWVTLKTTLLTTALFCLALLLWVVWITAHKAS